MRHKLNEADELDALFSRYAIALSFFERWTKRAVRTEQEIVAALRGYGPEGVREQVHDTLSVLSRTNVSTHIHWLHMHNSTPPRLL